MASKSAQHEPEKAEIIEEHLDHCDTTLDRVKVLYEQFFLGIQKQPPTHLHTDVERKLRELQQMQIRNTALRYRFATIQQKFGSYNNYWRRTLRQIENGTYHRNLAKIGRQAAMTGEEIPDEILAAMPKRMREQVKRDRDAAIAQKRRRDGTAEGDDFLDEVATGTSPAPRKTAAGAHVVDADDGEFDLDAYFRAVTNDDVAPTVSEVTNPGLRAFANEVPTETDLVAAPPRAATPASTPASVRAPTAASVRAPTPAPNPASIPAAAQPAPVRAPTPAPIGAPSRAGSPTATPVAGNAAVRAAVGMRFATPPVGVPLVGRPPALAHRPSQPAVPPSLEDSQVIPTQAIPTMRQPAEPQDTQVIPTMAIPTMRAGLPPQRPAPGMPSIPSPAMGANRPGVPSQVAPSQVAPSQVARPLPVMPGAASSRGPVPVETLAGPFPREQPAPRPGPPPPPKQTQAIPRPPPPAQTQAMPRTTQAIPRTTQPIDRVTQPIKPARATTEPGVTAPARSGPPPGMTDADVNALYAKYVKAKEAVGEKAGPGSYGKLLQTINAQAPKIMEQYKAKGVDFQVVVKDNQVVIRAKPKP